MNTSFGMFFEVVKFQVLTSSEFSSPNISEDLTVKFRKIGDNFVSSSRLHALSGSENLYITLNCPFSVGKVFQYFVGGTRFDSDTEFA